LIKKGKSGKSADITIVSGNAKQAFFCEPTAKMLLKQMLKREEKNFTVDARISLAILASIVNFLLPSERVGGGLGWGKKFTAHARIAI